MYMTKQVQTLHVLFLAPLATSPNYTGYMGANGMLWCMNWELPARNYRNFLDVTLSA
jgi:hypothetical protein